MSYTFPAFLYFVYMDSLRQNMANVAQLGNHKLHLALDQIRHSQHNRKFVLAIWPPTLSNIHGGYNWVYHTILTPHALAAGLLLHNPSCFHQLLPCFPPQPCLLAHTCSLAIMFRMAA